MGSQEGRAGDLPFVDEYGEFAADNASFGCTVTAATPAAALVRLAHDRWSWARVADGLLAAACARRMAETRGGVDVPS